MRSISGLQALFSSSIKLFDESPLNLFSLFIFTIKLRFRWIVFFDISIDSFSAVHSSSVSEREQNRFPVDYFTQNNNGDDNEHWDNSRFSGADAGQLDVNEKREQQMMNNNKRSQSTTSEDPTFLH